MIWGQYDMGSSFIVNGCSETRMNSNCNNDGNA